MLWIERHAACVPSGAAVEQNRACQGTKVHMVHMAFDITAVHDLTMCI